MLRNLSLNAAYLPHVGHLKSSVLIMQAGYGQHNTIASLENQAVGVQSRTMKNGQILPGQDLAVWLAKKLKRL